MVATRGERLVLFRIDFLSQGPPSEAFHAAALTIIEIDDDNRGAANVVFDIDEIDAAFAELDARYIAREAAPYRDAWSVIAAGYAALNRYEVPPSAPDYVAIDHRLQHVIEAADLGENLRAAWELTPELKGYVEVVHRLSSLGAVVTHAAHGTTQDGLDAEWRGIHFLTLEGGMVNRCEIFDEADLDAAIARFDELSRPARRMENAASRAPRAIPGVLRGRATGRRWRRCWPRTIPVTIAVGWLAPESDMVETPTSQICGRGPSCGTRIWNRPSWRSAGSASPSCASVCRTAT